MSSSRTANLLRRTARRLRLGSIGWRWYVAFLALCGVYLAALLAIRLSGAVPDWLRPRSSLTVGSGWPLVGFEPFALIAVPAAALLFALFWHRRPTPADAAREIDRHAGAKDLFLNASLLETSVGEFRPLVAQAAEQRAESIQPEKVVPYRGGRRLLYAGGALLALLLAAQHVPQLDPFGKVKAAQNVELEKKKLADSRKATQRRLEEVEREQAAEKQTQDVAAAVDKLKGALQKARPEAKIENFKTLIANQKILGQQWRKISAEKLKELLNQTPMSQQFGGASEDKMQKWSEELQRGSSEALEKELSQLQQQLERLERTQDPTEKAKLKRDLEQRLEDLKDFAQDKLNSKPLAAALERAMKQLAAAENKELSTEALQALSESMELAQVELKEIAQSAQDLKELEEALKALQMARQLNEMEKLDGGQCEGCQSMADYAKLYEQLLAQMGGTGPGMGNDGIGEGGEAPEDDSVESGFKTERSPTPITAGKILLSLKTQGVGEKGDAKAAYREAINQVAQGASEAILTEQIPPGYHDGIRNYFDSIRNSDGPSPPETPNAQP